LLNDYITHDLYKGTLLFRFDDTNPLKEKQEFQDSITEDLDVLGIKPDKTSHTSDHFQTLYEYCVRMIKEGNAYADDTDQKTMRDERMIGKASARRNRTVEENMAIFEGMIAGTEVQNCIRAKISVDNPNKAMRDPVIYRCNHTPHHRTGTLWKAYPTYDFACPLVDSLEGVTHALRTTEFADRNLQYRWFLDCLSLRRVHVWDFARLNFKRTFLSKRKLTKLVDAGRVWGWDYPRMPTIRGVLRRGMTISALRDFILKQGPSRNVTLMDWTIFWNINKKEIDPIAPRHTAVDQKQIVKATIKRGPEKAYTEDRPRHNKNPSLGTKKVAYSRHLILDQEDAKLFEQDEEITLMAWGNAIVRKINRSSPDYRSPVVDIELELHLEGDVKKTEKKITWLSTEGQGPIPVELVDFDYLLTKDKLEEDDNWEDFLTEQTEFRSAAFCDGNLAACKTGDIIQLERKGYFRVDAPYLV
jgi:glutamyl-tRNA synthetase